MTRRGLALGIPRLPILLASLIFVALVVYTFGPLLTCFDGCFVDLFALHGRKTSGFELADTRLNTWILAWVQHALLAQPLDLFHANALYPAPDALAGSEHLIGLALLTLPVRAFTSNAVLIHQLTLALSCWLLAMTTFALVRWLTGSVWAALAAGAIGLFMPWRTAELSHVQLLAAHWFPLIWLLSLRILLGEERRRDAWWLSVVLALQLLSSFYLAYQVSLTLVLLALVAALRAGAARRSLLRLGLAAAVPYALLVLSSAPYLGRESRGELFTSLDPEIPMGLETIADAWLLLAPRFDTLWRKSPGVDPSYFVPAVVGLLACFGLAFALARRPTQQAERRMEIATLSLWVCVLGAFVMSVGARISVGELDLPLPGYWAAKLVPGYANLRAPHRWGVTIGVAAPVLAGLAMRYLETVVPRGGIGRLGLSPRRLLPAALLGLLLVNVPWHRQLPAEAAWEHPERVAATYGALEALPHGPVLEIPWPVNPLTSIGRDTRYMVASTRHWRPILNGFTAYPPPSFDFLRRVARGLPEREAVTRLGRLTDLRWIVVHTAWLDRRQRRAWEVARARGGLRRVHADEHAWIFEMPQRADTAVWMHHLTSTARRSETLGGVSRAPLELAENAGRIEVVLLPRLRYVGTTPWRSPLRLAVTNASGVSWPGFDPHGEGLVQLRYTFSDEEDRVVKIDVAPLDTDVSAGTEVVASPLIRPPARRGRYRLCLDLVQTFEHGLRPLPVPPVEPDVDVSGVEPNRQGAAGRLARAYRDRSVVATGSVSPCAARSMPPPVGRDPTHGRRDGPAAASRSTDVSAPRRGPEP